MNTIDFYKNFLDKYFYYIDSKIIKPFYISKPLLIIEHENNFKPKYNTTGDSIDWEECNNIKYSKQIVYVEKGVTIDEDEYDVLHHIDDINLILGYTKAKTKHDNFNIPTFEQYLILYEHKTLNVNMYSDLFDHIWADDFCRIRIGHNKEKIHVVNTDEKPFIMNEKDNTIEPYNAIRLVYEIGE